MLQLSRIRKLGTICVMNLCFVAVIVIQSERLLAQSGQTFRSPEAATQALFAAAQASDQAAMLEIFGPGGNEITSTGDSIQDQNGLNEFVAKYREMHHLLKESDGATTLYIGAENWPFPVPLVNDSGVWHFDTEAGKKEILFRRIGENEYDAIDICHALVDAENDYYSHPRDGKVRQYAQKMASDEGQHNGLFWKMADDDPESPIGPVLAYAEGVSSDELTGEEHAPFRGYYFRILTGQGKAAQGGAKSYLVKGQMLAGFAILAYPAEYRSSGVMTFIVNQTGIVYEKDLGVETAQAAVEMKEYDPDQTWSLSE